MINQLDLRRVLIFLAWLVFFAPWAVFRLLSQVTGGVDHGFSRLWGGMHRWANPDLYGDAPVRCRRLVYSRRSVERLTGQIESLNRMVRRQEVKEREGAAEGPQIARLSVSADECKNSQAAQEAGS